MQHASLPAVALACAPQQTDLHLSIPSHARSSARLPKPHTEQCSGCPKFSHPKPLVQPTGGKASKTCMLCGTTGCACAPPMRFIAMAIVSCVSRLIAPRLMPPVQKRRMMPSAPSTSSMGTGSPTGVSSRQSRRKDTWPGRAGGRTSAPPPRTQDARHARMRTTLQSRPFHSSFCQQGACSMGVWKRPSLIASSLEGSTGNGSLAAVHERHRQTLRLRLQQPSIQEGGNASRRAPGCP